MFGPVRFAVERVGTGSVYLDLCVVRFGCWC